MTSVIIVLIVTLLAVMLTWKRHAIHIRLVVCVANGQWILHANSLYNKIWLHHPFHYKQVVNDMNIISHQR